MSNSPIFVAGTSRSGTTLTSEILGRHSRIFAPRSIDFLRSVDALRTQIGGHATTATARKAVLDRVGAFYSRSNDAPEQASVEQLIRTTDVARSMLSAHSLIEMCAIFLNAQATQVEKSRWVRHAPGTLYDLPRLFSLFPDAKVILCARNPLDYLVSYRDSFKRAERRNRIHEVRRLQKLYHPVITSLLWLASMRAARRALERYPDRVLLSRYEDLVADPEVQVRRICTFIGIEFEASMLAIAGNNSSEIVSRRGIFAISVGRWRDKLSEADAYIGQMICGREMRRLGYAPVSLRFDIAQVSWRILTTPFFACSALFANSNKRTSALSYLIKRLSPLVRLRRA
jgi:hypothetical protein